MLCSWYAKSDYFIPLFFSTFFLSSLSVSLSLSLPLSLSLSLSLSLFHSLIHPLSHSHASLPTSKADQSFLRRLKTKRMLFMSWIGSVRTCYMLLASKGMWRQSPTCLANTRIRTSSCVTRTDGPHCIVRPANSTPKSVKCSSREAHPLMPKTAPSQAPLPMLSGMLHNTTQHAHTHNTHNTHTTRTHAHTRTHTHTHNTHIL